MRVSYRWLSEFVDIEESPEELASLLSSKGLEVEELQEIGREESVVIEVLNISKETLKLSTGKELRGDFTGLKPKDRVALSKDGRIIKERDIGLEGSSYLILPKEWKPGRRLSDYLRDWIFDIEIPANRGDLLSIMGVAREIAAYKGKRIRLPKPKVKRGEISIRDFVSLKVSDPEANPRYIAKLLMDVKINSSPLLIKWRLLNLGIRSVNNIVDATNYVMLEMGQPLHTFDYDKLEGGKIITRWAKDGEEIRTIDGVLRRLNSKIYVIADEKRPIAIAGVEGGIETEVTPSTKRVLLECAHFSPLPIRYASSYLSLNTEASRRFSSGVDPEFADTASLKAASLISGTLTQDDIEYYKARRIKGINLSYERVKTLLGVEIKRGEIRRILSLLGFRVKNRDKGWRVEVPSFRQDISCDAELTEEIARLYGYDRIPSKVSFYTPHPGAKSEYSKRIGIIKEFFVNYGFSEIKTLSFIPNFQDNGSLKILNPLSQRFSYLRRDLLIPGLEVVGQNHRKGNLDLKLFELGKVFTPDKKEPVHLAGLISGSFYPEFWKDRRRFSDFFDLKGIIEELFQWLRIGEVLFAPCAKRFLSQPSSLIRWNDREIGWLGRIEDSICDRFDINIPVYAFEIDLDEVLKLTPEYKRYTPISKFPAVKRDLAFIIDKTIPASELIGVIKEVSGSLLEKVELFDLFEGKLLPPAKRSLGVRFTISSKERTLNNEEVEELISKVVKEVEDKLKGRLRR